MNNGARIMLFHNHPSGEYRTKWSGFCIYRKNDGRWRYARDWGYWSYNSDKQWISIIKGKRFNVKN